MENGEFSGLTEEIGHAEAQDNAELSDGAAEEATEAVQLSTSSSRNQLPPPRPPPPNIRLIPQKSTTFDGAIRLNDLLRREENSDNPSENGPSCGTSLPSRASFSNSASVTDANSSAIKEQGVQRLRSASPFLLKSHSSDNGADDNRDSASNDGSIDGRLQKQQSFERDNRRRSTGARLQSFMAKAKEKIRRHGKGSSQPREIITPEVDEVARDVLSAPTTGRYSSPPSDRSAVSADDDHIQAIYTQSVLADAPQQPQTQPIPPPRRRRRDMTPDLRQRQSSLAVHGQLPFSKWMVCWAVLLAALTLFVPSLHFITGFFWGVYMCTVVFLYAFVSAPIEEQFAHKAVHADIEAEVANIAAAGTSEIPEERPVVYKGWLNELHGVYHATKYHVNSTRSALVRLEGKTLRVQRPERNVFKHTFYGEHTLMTAEPTMIGQSIYDLTDAQVCLRPKNLARRRWWSRKYPIVIKLANEKSVVASVGGAMRSVRSAERRLASPSEEHQMLPGASSSTNTDTTREYDADSSSADEEIVKERNGGVKCVRRTHRKTSSRSMFDISSIGNLVDDGNVTLQATSGKKEKGPKLYFFVRSAREKERWFHLLRKVCAQYRSSSHLAGGSGNLLEVPVGLPRRASSLSLQPSSSAADDRAFLPGRVQALRELADRVVQQEYLQYLRNQVQFARVMESVLRSIASLEQQTGGASDDVVHMDLGKNKWSFQEADNRSEIVAAANALAARVFFDFCRDEYWIRAVRNKIQTKLATVHLPYYIETLSLSRLDVGTTSPQIIGVHEPVLNDWGLWIDLEIKHLGGLRLVLETKFNMLKLREGGETVAGSLQRNTSISSRTTVDTRQQHYSDEERPESPESSPDEDFTPLRKKKDVDVSSPSNVRRKDYYLGLMEKIAGSKVFQEIAQHNVVKKVMEGVSSTRLVLNVQVQYLEGTVALNIPPPPSDRIWYGFRKPPTVVIKAVPQVGDRSVELSPISEWIETRLKLLLEKNLVCPNMDDIVIPIMAGNEMFNFGYNK